MRRFLVHWDKGVDGPGWNERVYRSRDGKFTITSMMMSGRRNGTWRKEWRLEAPTLFRGARFYDSLGEAKEMCEPEFAG